VTPTWRDLFDDLLEVVRSVTEPLWLAWDRLVHHCADRIAGTVPFDDL
jgi:hypothetical protein